MGATDMTLFDQLVGTAKASGKVTIVWKIILDGCGSVATLDVKLGFKHALWQQLAIHTTHGVTRHLGEQESPALPTLGARTGSQSENGRFAAQYHDVSCRIQAA